MMDNKGEIDLWRESALAPLPPTSRYGLAFAALMRGFRVEILTNVKGLELRPPPRGPGVAAGEFMQTYLKWWQVHFEERKARALELGLRERRLRIIGIRDVGRALRGGGLGMVLTSSRFFDDEEDWAHWIVVTEIEGDKVFVNDPSSGLENGRRVFDNEKFEEINQYYGSQVLISIRR